MELKDLQVDKLYKNFNQTVRILEIREDLNGAIVLEVGKRTKWLADPSNLSQIEK